MHDKKIKKKFIKTRSYNFYTEIERNSRNFSLTRSISISKKKTYKKKKNKVQAETTLHTYCVVSKHFHESAWSEMGTKRGRFVYEKKKKEKKFIHKQIRRTIIKSIY